MKFYFLILSFLFLSNSYGQKKNSVNAEKKTDSVNFVLGFRVNFKTHPDQKKIFELYKNYFYTLVPSKKQNPYWTAIKTPGVPNYNLSLTSIFGFQQGINLQFFKDYVNITILSIEKLNDSLYTISAQYQYKGKPQPSSILCTQRLEAVKENGTWKLQNHLVHYTRNWNVMHTGHIYFHYDCNYQINKDLTTRAGKFYDSIIDLFGLTAKDRIDYYLATDVQQLGELRGFDYFGVGITTGITDQKNGFLFSSKGAFHAHELVHMALYSREIKRSFLLTEGCAEFLGSSYQFPKEYEKGMKKLSIDIKNDSTYTIQNLISMRNKISWNGYNYKYYFGALLCKLVYNKTGIEGLRKLLFSNTRKTENLVSTLKAILKIENTNLLYKKIKVYALHTME